jgi:hypothetical protein
MSAASTAYASTSVAMRNRANSIRTAWPASVIVADTAAYFAHRNGITAAPTSRRVAIESNRDRIGIERTDLQEDAIDTPGAQGDHIS